MPLREQAETAKRYLILRDEQRTLEISLWMERLEELGLDTPAGDLEPPDIKAGKRIGIDYAEEAIDFPWRFYV